MTRIWAKLILLTLVLSLLTNICFAASLSGEKNWQVPILGIFRAPQEFMAAEFPDVKKNIDSQKVKLDSKLELPMANAEDKLKPDRVDFTAYQLTMNDGQAYHLAWLVAVRDRVALDPQTLAYFDNPLNIEQRVAAVMMQDKLHQNLDTMQYTDPTTGMGLKVLDFDQFDLGNISGKQAYAGGVRFLINYQDFLFPLYARCWIFNAGGYGTAVLLVTTDSERAFWTPVLNSMMSTLRPLPPVKSSK
ncbi:MAG: hypothetical protein K0Q77_755 [Anaerosporomusa subterranea]|jgi:hypothetical protein|nr:hypothetical protein [Anaerosporomusa subterranea]